MTELERIWTTIGEIVAEYKSADGTKYEPSRDPFTFETDLRGDVASWYIEPPGLDQGVQFLGGGGSMIARCAVWLSRSRSDDPDRAALALATDLDAIRRAIDDVNGDWFVQPGASVRIATGDDGQDTTVIGSLTMAIDDEDF